MPVSRGYSGADGGYLHLVTQAAKIANQFAGTLVNGLWVWLLSALFIAEVLVQDLPDNAAYFMGYCPDRLVVSAPARHPPVQNLKHAAFGFDGGISPLIQN